MAQTVLRVLTLGQCYIARPQQTVKSESKRTTVWYKYGFQLPKGTYIVHVVWCDSKYGFVKLRNVVNAGYLLWDNSIDFVEFLRS